VRHITGTIHRRGVASHLFADAIEPLPMEREAPASGVAAR
jgi:hypothetical protein